MFRSLIALTLISLIVPMSLKAHDHSVNPSNTEEGCCGNKPQIKHEAPKTEEEAILRVLNLFHYAIDGEHSHIDNFKDILKTLFHPSTYLKLAQNTNFKRVGANAFRAYNIEAQHEITRKHARRMLYIFPVSHGIEFAATPAFLYFSYLYNLSGATVAIVTPALTAIAIPGLDVLCILIFASYPLKAVHRPIGFIAESFEKALRPFFKSLDNYERGPGLERVKQNLEHIMKYVKKSRTENNASSSSVLLFNSNDKPMMNLTFQTDSKTTYLKEISISNSNSVDYERAEFITRKILSFNSAYAAKQVLMAHKKSTLGDKESLFYVEDVTEKDRFTDIKFQDFSLIIPGLKRAKACLNVFASAPAL